MPSLAVVQSYGGYGAVAAQDTSGAIGVDKGGGHSSDASPSVPTPESKQRARVKMAESEVDIEETPQDQAHNGGAAIGHDSDREGSAVSRKRSRSGSRRPQIQPNNLPARTKESFDRFQTEQYVNRELAHQSQAFEAMQRGNRLRKEHDNRITFYKHHVGVPYRQPHEVSQKTRDPAQIFGNGYCTHDNSVQRVMFPSNNSRTSIQSSRLVRSFKKDRDIQAEQTEELVPIRLDIEVDKVRLRDSFTWNLNDRTISPRMFSERLVQDFGLVQEKYPTVYPALVQQVHASIQEQLADHHPHVTIHEGPLDPYLPYTAYKDDELRVLIKLNITIGPNTLVDQFEWDINNPINSPEEFARQMARDLSLSGEFTTAIAHAIREQCQLFTKSLYVVGHGFDGRPIEDHELAASFQPSPLPSVFRPYQAAKEYTPFLYDLNEAELEKTELVVSREERRQKRSVNRRGGPALPDLKDRPKTLRTLLVSSTLPGGVDDIEETRIFKRVPTVGKVKKGRNEDSDDSDSDVSMADSAVTPQQIAGTTRTRGMRGAASAAQAALRTTGRSVTPAGFRESSSPEPTSLVVKLKIPKVRLQQLQRDQRSRNRDPRPPSGQSPSKPGSMGPPSGTPRSHHQNLPGNGTLPAPKTSEPHSTKHIASLGRVATPGPPSEGHPVPPPPEELIKSLDALQKDYPDDAFEAVMRLTVVDDTTNEGVSLKPGSALPPNTSYYYYPRIRCKDCPGKLYTPDQNLGVSNFEVHLKNKQHRTKVKQRIDGEAPVSA